MVTIIKKEKLLKYLVSPAVIYSVLAGVLPVIYAFRNSLYNINIRYPMRVLKFIGFDNYINILQTSRFQAALKNSLLFSIEGTIGALILGFAIALYLYYYVRPYPLVLTLLSTLLVVPVLAGKVTNAYMWKLLYNPVLGIINHIIRGLGFGTVEFLSNSKLAMHSIVFTDIWQWSGFIALFLYAGLASLPEEFFEEARVIGASFFQTMRYVIIPNLKGLFLAVFLLKFMISLRSFGLIKIMTGGGPGVTTETVDMYLSWLAVGGRGALSKASAGAIVMLIITIIVFTIIIRLYQGQKEGGK
ncbi:MAG: sugar ABC transporter permease [Halanaerobiales bacterium]|nr:sugar ABC transporter permease [Halanaerobiales bacterium]